MLFGRELLLSVLTHPTIQISSSQRRLRAVDIYSRVYDGFISTGCYILQTARLQRSGIFWGVGIIMWNLLPYSLSCCRNLDFLYLYVTPLHYSTGYSTYSHYRISEDHFQVIQNDQLYK